MTMFKNLRTAAGLTVLALIAPKAQSGWLDEAAQARAALDNPAGGRGAKLQALSLSFEAGKVIWERGRCRILPLVLGGDTLWWVELSGKGRLQPAWPGAGDSLAARAFLGRDYASLKVDRLSILARRLPHMLEGLAWKRLKPALPFLPLAGFPQASQLDALSPDHPWLHLPAPDDGVPVWLSAEPAGLQWSRVDGQSRWSLRLHAGSSLFHPLSASGEACWLPPTLARPAQPFDSLRLKLEAAGGRPAWLLEVDCAAGDSALWLELDPGARLDGALWRDSSGRRWPARHSRQDGFSGPWLRVERPSSAPATLQLSGTCPSEVAVNRAAGLRVATGGSWFPVLPWWEAPRPARVADPGKLAFPWPDSLAATMDPGRLDASSAQRLVPEERTPRPLSRHAALAWTSLGRTAGFAAQHPAQVRRHTQAIDNLDLPRERDVRPPDRDSPAEPRDLALGQDTLTMGLLAEERVLEGLSQAARRLEAWLGTPPFPVLLSERVGPERTRRGEEDRLLEHALDAGLPLEIPARTLRDAAPASRLARLETLCRGWWPQPAGEAGAAPRWIRRGAARACALRLLEAESGPAMAARLRLHAIEELASDFQPSATTTVPDLGERAAGVWRSEATQDLLAWRFALLLETLRWRLREPASLDDGAWLDLMADLSRRLAEPAYPRQPLAETRAAVADFLVANDLLERAAFQSAPEVWLWFEQEWRAPATRIPAVAVETGRVETAEGPRLALRTDWSAAPGAGAVLPVLVRTRAGHQAFSLKAGLPREQYLLPLDPAEVEGLELAPGGCLAARVQTR